MSTFGGRELNVSSDIDLVFLYPGALDQQERYETAGRKLIRLLAELTEDGFAFRVDMRLRPFGDAGPLACSFDSLETYLIARSEEHTSELQSQSNLVCRLLLEKKKKTKSAEPPT